jgi:hypothetical protein
MANNDFGRTSSIDLIPLPGWLLEKYEVVGTHHGITELRLKDEKDNPKIPDSMVDDQWKARSIKD